MSKPLPQHCNLFRKKIPEITCFIQIAPDWCHQYNATFKTVNWNAMRGLSHLQFQVKHNCLKYHTAEVNRKRRLKNDKVGWLTKRNNQGKTENSAVQILFYLNLGFHSMHNSLYQCFIILYFKHFIGLPTSRKPICCFPCVICFKHYE